MIVCTFLILSELIGFDLILPDLIGSYRILPRVVGPAPAIDGVPGSSAKKDEDMMALIIGVQYEN